MVFREVVFARSRGNGANGHHDDVIAPQIRFLQDLLKVRQPVEIADRHQNTSRPRVNRAAAPADIRPHVESELFEALFLFRAFAFEPARDHMAKSSRVNPTPEIVAICLENRFAGNEEQDQRRQGQANGQFAPAHAILRVSVP